MSGKINIHGKEYKTVALRVSEFREKYPENPILTEIVQLDNEKVIMKASILNNGSVIATGFAEEYRDASKINKTSALENCETSAIGRALANFGFAGSEYASANEVSDAIIQQNRKEVGEYFVRYNQAVKDLFPVINEIKELLSKGDIPGAAQVWYEMTNEERQSIHLAPTKGGIFTVEERNIIRSDEFTKCA